MRRDAARSNGPSDNGGKWVRGGFAAGASSWHRRLEFLARMFGGGGGAMPERGTVDAVGLR